MKTFCQPKFMPMANLIHKVLDTNLHTCAKDKRSSTLWLIVNIVLLHTPKCASSRWKNGNFIKIPTLCIVVVFNPHPTYGHSKPFTAMAACSPLGFSRLPIKVQVCLFDLYFQIPLSKPPSAFPPWRISSVLCLIGSMVAR